MLILKEVAKFFKLIAMKKIILYLGFTILAIAFIYSCKPEDFKPVGDPIDKTDLMVGTWNVTKVTQIDVDAQQKGYPTFATEMDITNVFPDNSFSDIEINLNEDKTFTISKANAYVSWPESGTWTLNHPVHASKLYLIQQTDTLTLNISSFAELVMSPAKITLTETKQQKVGDNFVDAIYYNYEISKP